MQGTEISLRLAGYGFPCWPRGVAADGKCMRLGSLGGPLAKDCDRHRPWEHLWDGWGPRGDLVIWAHGHGEPAGNAW